MARSFHRRQQLPPIAELNVIPLIDLAFSLLIIFMISTPLIEKNERTIPIDLPVSSEAKTRQTNQRFVSITISQGSYNVDGRTMTRDQLESLLRSYVGSANPPVFSLRQDRNAPWQEMVTVLDLLTRNNLSKISFDTRAQR